LVYGPGGYHFTDFVWVGTPLTVLVALIVTWLAPRLWPQSCRAAPGSVDGWSETDRRQPQRRDAGMEHPRCRPCWFIQEGADQRSSIRGLNAKETQSSPLEIPTPMAWTIDRATSPTASVVARCGDRGACQARRGREAREEEREWGRGRDHDAGVRLDHAGGDRGDGDNGLQGRCRRSCSIAVPGGR
jgi:hypothetical protein